MARLFIFAIGGTGSRVLKSLTMLLASGVKPETNTEYEIVPIIIDPHKANEDLKRTINILDLYQEITDEVDTTNGFFGTRITTLKRLSKNKEKFKDNYTFNLQEVSNSRFKDYIDYNTLDVPNKAFADLLFSGSSINKRGEKVDLLDVEMDIGFVGNPNIGSVVLNQFKESEEFVEFANNFNENDRIFIVSSIFGGTGAAGFPTILKNLRKASDNPKISNVGFLENAKIGAISVLPYFNIESKESSPIDKGDFIAKTKSALYYYKDNVTGNRSVNAMYYIADNYSGKPYTNDPGDSGQKNDAHFVELASAMAIVDFLEIPDGQLSCDSGKAERPVYREFGIKKDVESIGISDLGNTTQDKISLPISQFYLFNKYVDEQLRSSIGKNTWCNDEPKVDNTFLTTTFYKSDLSEFLKHFSTWLNELSINKRGFAPFNFGSSLDTSIKGIPAESGFFTKKVSYDNYVGALNNASKNSKFPSSSQKFIKLFHSATKDILNSKFPYFKVKA
jgi:hypothetical protein